MAEARPWQGLLRERGPGKARVLPIELFFDLVYVFAITQLSHLLLAHLTPHGVFQTILLEVAVWVAWVYTAWFTNWFDPNRRVIRSVLVAVMVASLIMSASLPEAFAGRGLLFAGGYVATQVFRVAFSVIALAGYPAQQRNFQRILFWMLISGFLWIAGGLATGAARETFWVAAVVVDLIAPALGF